MNKFIALAFATSCICAFSTPSFAAQTCTNPGTPAANKTLVKKFYFAVDTKNKALLDDVLAKDWVDVPMAPGQQPGRDGMKGALEGYYASFPDFNAVNQDMIAEGDKVVVRSIIHATQRGSFAGVAASNRPIKIMAIDIHQICDGHVVKTWHVEDWLSGLFQMGSLPAKHAAK